MRTVCYYHLWHCLLEFPQTGALIWTFLARTEYSAHSPLWNSQLWQQCLLAGLLCDLVMSVDGIVVECLRRSVLWLGWLFSWDSRGFGNNARLVQLPRRKDRYLRNHIHYLIFRILSQIVRGCRVKRLTFRLSTGANSVQRVITVWAGFHD